MPLKTLEIYMSYKTGSAGSIVDLKYGNTNDKSNSLDTLVANSVILPSLCNRQRRNTNRKSKNCNIYIQFLQLKKVSDGAENNRVTTFSYEIRTLPTNLTM